MRAFVASLSTIGVSLLLGFFAVEKLCLFHATYELRQAKIDKEAWLRDRCTDPVFYTHMGEHTNLCREVEATARIGAVWHAVNTVADSLPVVHVAEAVQRASWPVLATLSFVCLFFPSILIAWVRGGAPPPALPKYAA